MDILAKVTTNDNGRVHQTLSCNKDFQLNKEYLMKYLTGLLLAPMLCNAVGLNTNEPMKALSVDYLAPGDSITLPFTADKIGDTKIEVTLNELPFINDPSNNYSIQIINWSHSYDDILAEFSYYDVEDDRMIATTVNAKDIDVVITNFSDVGIYDFDVQGRMLNPDAIPEESLTDETRRLDWELGRVGPDSYLLHHVDVANGEIGRVQFNLQDLPLISSSDPQHYLVEVRYIGDDGGRKYEYFNKQQAVNNNLTFTLVGRDFEVYVYNDRQENDENLPVKLSASLLNDAEGVDTLLNADNPTETAILGQVGPDSYIRHYLSVNDSELGRVQFDLSNLPTFIDERRPLFRVEYTNAFGESDTKEYFYSEASNNNLSFTLTGNDFIFIIENDQLDEVNLPVILKGKLLSTAGTVDTVLKKNQPIQAEVLGRVGPNGYIRQHVYTEYGSAKNVEFHLTQLPNVTPYMTYTVVNVNYKDEFGFTDYVSFVPSEMKDNKISFNLTGKEFDVTVENDDAHGDEPVPVHLVTRVINDCDFFADSRTNQNVRLKSSCLSEYFSGRYSTYHSFYVNENTSVRVEGWSNADDKLDNFLVLRKGIGRSGEVIAVDDDSSKRTTLGARHIGMLEKGYYTVELTTDDGKVTGRQIFRWYKTQ